MTDVISIAKKCRAELTTEIARLDEFIRMAEKLQQYEALAKSAEAEVELTPSLAAGGGGARVASAARA